MKKSLALLLLLLVCLLSCMLPLRYGLTQAAKLIMHQRMQQEKGESFILLAAADLRAAEWEHDHEFRLDGQMYDVKGIEYHDGLKYYRCIPDDLEMRMERRADEMTSCIAGHGRGKADGGIAKALSDWLQGLYFQPTSAQDICFPTGVTASFPPIAAHAVEDPFPDSSIIPPEA